MDRLINIGMQPYYTVPFSFTQESFDWLLNFVEPIEEKFNQNSATNISLVSFNDTELETLYKHAIIDEVNEFSNRHRLKAPHLELFIYKNRDRLQHPLTNPHVDTNKRNVGNLRITSTRFNILLRGNSQAEMVWWDEDKTNQHAVLSTYVSFNNIKRFWRAPSGNSAEERWKLIGDPDITATNLTKVQEYASFIRTDILHTIFWTETRLILSFCYDEPWEVIANQLGTQSG